MKKSTILTAGEIQKEQLFLVQLERELTDVIEKINENLNTLKVEELQLRSNAVNILNNSALQKTTVEKKPITKTEEHPIFNDNPETVNQQELDLDVYLSHFNGEENDE